MRESGARPTMLRPCERATENSTTRSGSSATRVSISDSPPRRSAKLGLQRRGSRRRCRGCACDYSEVDATRSISPHLIYWVPHGCELVVAERVRNNYEEIDVAVARREVIDGEGAVEDHRDHGVFERV
jgi:hypothetical protein